jgi:hypothetical protein
MSQLSFDGFGINGPDKYRTRLATFANDEAGKAYGKLFEASPDLLAALELDLTFHSRFLCESSLPEFRQAGYTGTSDGKSMKRWLGELKDAAIAKAKGESK